MAGPLALAAGGIGGLIVGGLVAWLLLPSSTIEVPRAPTPEELAAACAVPATAEAVDELGTAQTKVATLERDVATKERRVKELEEEMAKRSERGKEFVAELNRVKAELATAKEQLVVAEQEKAQLLETLRLTTEELTVTKNQRDTAREEALFNRWNDFVANAQLEICDKGNRKKLGNCREVVQATVGSEKRQGQFSHCIRSGQAAPVVQERVDDKASLPAFAEMIDEEQKQTKGWMVIFCDPTLPEAQDAPLAAGRLPQ
ncbi:MAG: hypothetical protein ABMA64_01410 [Myxococcota bacterium]